MEDGNYRMMPGLPHRQTPQRKEKDPFFFFFLAFFVFPLSEYADWLVLTIPQSALLEARSEECPHPCIMKKEGTTALEHLIPVGATLWSQQAV